MTGGGRLPAIIAVLALLREERARLGEFLDTLGDDHWEAPSLCAGWRVRDVVAHCSHDHRATPWNFLPE